MLRLVKGLKVRLGSGNCGLLVRDGSSILLRPGLVFTIELEGYKA